MAKLGVLVAVLVYAAFVGSVVYLAGFVGNVPGLPKTLDRGPSGPVAQSVAVNIALLLLFGLQHSGMARASFKRWSTRLVPAALERSSYVLASTLVLALLMWQWRPLPSPVVWAVEDPRGRAVLLALWGLGWVVLLVSTFLLSHFELFGLRQAVARWRGHDMAESALETPLLYRYVRHPIYLGFLIVFWVTPTMTAGHLLFAAGFTVYVFIGVAFEERDLVAKFGDRYRAYRAEVGMLVPRWRQRPGGPEAH